jgi:hypothetical protein
MKKARKQTQPTKAESVPRLVRFPADDDAWLEKRAERLAATRGKATIQDCVREIVRRARETEATAT